MSQKSDLQNETCGKPALRRSMRLRKITTPPPSSVITRKASASNKELPIVNEDTVKTSRDDDSNSPISSMTSENFTRTAELEEKDAAVSHIVEGDSQEHEDKENIKHTSLIVSNGHIDSSTEDLVPEEKHFDSNKNGPSEADGSNTDLKKIVGQDVKKKLSIAVCHTDKIQVCSDVSNDINIKQNGGHFKKSIINWLNTNSSEQEDSEIQVSAKVLGSGNDEAVEQMRKNETLPIANDNENEEKIDFHEQSVVNGEQNKSEELYKCAIADKIDELLLDSDNSVYATSESDANSFIDVMAEEGEEDTPSEGSNDIIEVGEEINTTESELSSNESYERDSFIDDEKYQLLSGEEYDLSFEDTKDTQRRRRIISLSSGSDDSIIPIKKREKEVVKKRKKSRIIRFEDSSDEEAANPEIQTESQENLNANMIDSEENQHATEVQNEDLETCTQNCGTVCENENTVKDKNIDEHETYIQSDHISTDPSTAVMTNLGNTEDTGGGESTEIQDEDRNTETCSTETPHQVVTCTPSIKENSVTTDLGNTVDSVGAEHTEIQDEGKNEASSRGTPHQVVACTPSIEENSVMTDLGNNVDSVGAEHTEIQDENKDTRTCTTEIPYQVVTSTSPTKNNSVTTDLGNTEDIVGAEHTQIQDKDENTKASSIETVYQVVTSTPTDKENCNKKIIILEDIRILNFVHKGCGDRITEGTNSKSVEVKDASDLSASLGSNFHKVHKDGIGQPTDISVENSQINDKTLEGETSSNCKGSVDGKVQELPDKVRKRKKKRNKQRALVGLLIDEVKVSPQNGCHTTEVNHSPIKSDKQKVQSHDNNKKRKHSDTDLSTSDLVVKRRKKNKHKHPTHESAGTDKQCNILDEAVLLSKKNNCILRTFSDEDWNSGDISVKKRPQISKTSSTNNSIKKINANSIKKINPKNFRDFMLYDNKRVKRMDTQQLLRKKFY